MKHLSYYSEIKDPAVDWVFRFLSTAIGCRFYPVTELDQASVVYSNLPAQGDQLQIPIWTPCYNGTYTHFILPIGYWLPDYAAVSAVSTDFISLVLRLLTLADEIALPDNMRDRLGNLSTHSAFPRSAYGDLPMVDMAVQQFKQKLVERGLLREDELLPRWPKGKRYAVLITHDTDGPCLLDTRELVKAGIKGFFAFDTPEKQAFFEGCRGRILGNSDPYFNFSRWAEFEQSLGVTSAFYIYVKSKGVPGHIHNPPYRVKKSDSKWDILHELADRGWEIGLHSSIHALRNDSYLQTEKKDLENFLGETVVGNRCHYWRINWRDPSESLRSLESVGITYDCSIAWKDRPGFRSGTVTPYHPYDPKQSYNLRLLEIPTNIMDGHLFQYQKKSDPSTGFASIVQSVKKYGGVLNLDWHTRTWVDHFSYAGWRSFLVEKLVELAESGEGWFTTPRNLSEFWLSREKQIGDCTPRSYNVQVKFKSEA